MHTVSSGARVRDIATDDLPAVAEFLTAQLNHRISPRGWVERLAQPWAGPDPVRGFLVEVDDAIVGVQLLFVSTRQLDGRTVTVCNLGALCIAAPHRSQALRLVRAALAMRDCVFTDLSPSGAVVALNERLGFVHLDTATALVPALCLPRVVSTGGARATATADLDVIARSVAERDAEILRDHRGAMGARHVLLQKDGASCYVVYRRDRRKGIPVFASLLHVSDPAALHAMFPALSRFLLRQGVLAILAELRVVGSKPRRSRMLARSRPKMVRTRGIAPESVDYLYSELTCVAW